MSKELLKKHNYYLTISTKNWCKFIQTGKEPYLDKSIAFKEKAMEEYRKWLKTT